MSEKFVGGEGVFPLHGDDEVPTPEPSSNGAGPKDEDKEPTLDETLPGGGAGNPNGDPK